MSKFKPNVYLKTIYELDLDYLVKRGIKNILIDLDNTLVPHYEKNPTETSRIFIEKLLAKGFNVIIFSNNKYKRVQYFSEQIGLPYVYSARKPLKLNYIKTLAKYHFQTKETVCIGDQLLTDIYGANRMKMLNILVDPLVEKDIFYTKINRVFEKIIIKALFIKYDYEQGKYFYD